MKRQLLATIAAVGILMGSCKKDNANISENQAITFSGKINGLVATTTTGNSSTSWIGGDNIGVFMVDNNTSNVTDNNTNRSYRFIASRFAAVPGNEIYFPVDNKKVDFISYYPYKAGYELATPIQLDVADQTDLSILDFLYAKSTNNGAGYSKSTLTNVPLEFSHKLSKIIIKPLAGEGLLATDPLWNSMKVQINGLNSKGSLDLKTGAISSASTPISIVPKEISAGVTYEAITIPSEYATAGAFSINFQIGSDTYVWHSGANENFESGKEYTYTITVNKTGLVLNNVTIQDWTSVYRTGQAN